MIEVREQELTRYILPLREGGSLPGLAEADDGFRYAVKFRGAGHGTKSLIAELIGGLVAKALKLRVPETVFLKLSPLFGITEPDYEVQQLLRKSEGLNLGLHFLDRAVTFEPSINKTDSLLASKIVWFDAFMENIDRTRQNPNMMMWHNELWLIDHGSSLYFHHTEKDVETAALDEFGYIKNHVLLSRASQLEEADRLMRQAITPRTLEKIVDVVPEEWIEESGRSRDDYKRFLTFRLANSKNFVSRAIAEREKLIK